MSIIKSTETIHGEEITILIESNSPMPDSGRATRGVNPVADTLKQAQGVLAGGVDLIRHCAMQVVQGLDAVQKPEELEVQLAIKLGSDAGALLVSISAEAQMQVTMKWKFQNGCNTADS